MRELSKEMQILIEQEVKNKSRSRGVRMETVDFFRLSSRPKLSQEIEGIVCNPEQKTFIKEYKERGIK